MPPLLLRGGDTGSGFTCRSALLGVVAGADRDIGVDLDADPEEDELAAMRRGCQLLPRRRDAGVLEGGGIVRTG